jgi:hypothetical protein
VCLLAGIGVIILGFYLGKAELALKKAIEVATKEVGESTKSTSRRTTTERGAGGIGATAEQQALIPDISEAAKGLGELAKGLQGLPAAIQAFLISIMFFVIAAGLAVAQLYK